MPPKETTPPPGSPVPRVRPHWPSDRVAALSLVGVRAPVGPVVLWCRGWRGGGCPPPVGPVAASVGELCAEAAVAAHARGAQVGGIEPEVRAHGQRHDVIHSPQLRREGHQVDTADPAHVPVADQHTLTNLAPRGVIWVAPVFARPRWTRLPSRGHLVSSVPAGVAGSARTHVACFSRVVCRSAARSTSR